MLVYLNEYRRDEASETVRHGEEVADTDEEEYFGTDDVGPEEWERIDLPGRDDPEEIEHPRRRRGRLDAGEGNRR